MEEDDHVVGGIEVTSSQMDDPFRALSTQATTATVSRYASPKRQKDIDSIKRNSIPQKTRCSTDWAVKVWKDWAESRNKRLLPGENAFCTSINDLTVTEMNENAYKLLQLSLNLLKPAQKSKENLLPNICISGGTNITINFSS